MVINNDRNSKTSIEKNVYNGFKIISKHDAVLKLNMMFRKNTDFLLKV